MEIFKATLIITGLQPLIYYCPKNSPVMVSYADTIFERIVFYVFNKFSYSFE